jgi:hypothetical protein
MSTLQEYLADEVKHWAVIGHPALMQRFILRNGKAFSKIAPQPKRMKAKHCFANCTRWVQKRGGTYVEGYTIADNLPIAIHHAWIVDDDGVVIDPTAARTDPQWILWPARYRTGRERPPDVRSRSGVGRHRQRREAKPGMAEVFRNGGHAMKACYIVVPGAEPGKRIGIVKQGEVGYYLTDYDNVPSMSLVEITGMVEQFNLKLGVDAKTADAMLIGSMFGWDVPGAMEG